jgi:hypothetical protein
MKTNSVEKESLDGKTIKREQNLGRKKNPGNNLNHNKEIR